MMKVEALKASNAEAEAKISWLNIKALSAEAVVRDMQSCWPAEEREAMAKLARQVVHAKQQHLLAGGEGGQPWIMNGEGLPQANFIEVRGGCGGLAFSVLIAQLFAARPLLWQGSNGVLQHAQPPVIPAACCLSSGDQGRAQAEGRGGGSTPGGGGPGNTQPAGGGRQAGSTGSQG